MALRMSDGTQLWQASLVAEQLDLQTGVSVGREITALPESGWDAVWAERMAWFDIGGTVYAVDRTNGKTVYQIP